MSSVTYVVIGLNSVEEYWNQLVVPNVKEFRTKASPPSAFQAALSLWHLHDWVWHDRNRGQDSSGPAFDAYRAQLLVNCPELGWLRDIADAGKHRGLGRTPAVQSTSQDLMPGPNMTVGGRGGFKEFMTLELNDGSKHNVGTTLQKTVDFWRKELKAKNLAEP